MEYDAFGQAHCSSKELCELLYKNPALDLTRFLVDDVEEFNRSVDIQYAAFPKLTQYQATVAESIVEFDHSNQQQWYMPREYSSLDIAQYVLDLCKTQAELQRVGEELLLYQERDLFDLLRYLKYFVDTLRSNQVIWGVGRGSSTASYILYLLGVHRINSLYFDLDIKEFLK